MTPGTRLDPYEILAPLGAGGMGEVWRVRDTRLGRDVAIKVLPADFSADTNRLQRFEQEARAVAALNHPNILVVHDVGTHDGAPYLVSELLEGQALREVIKAGPLSSRKATDYALQIAQGLAAAHAKNIVHRDLKPENIFVTKDGRLKILDFGLAKLRANPKSEIRNPKSPADPDAPTVMQAQTEPGAVMGTPGYMSPEQVSGQEADHRSDIFSFGAILYEMLSGQRAFRKETSIETMHAILRDEPPELSESNPNLSPSLERVVRRCLEKRAEQRFQSASDLAFALENISGTTASIRVPAQIPTRTLLRQKWALAALGAVLGALGAAVMVWKFMPKTTGESVQAHVSVALPEALAVVLARKPMLALAPNGRSVVYAARATNGITQLWEQRLDQPALRPIPGTEGAHTPFFSPDGKWVGFSVAERDGIMKVSLEGGAPVTILKNSDYMLGACWAPDGNIYYCPGWIEGVWKIDAEAKQKPTRIAAVDPAKNERTLIWPDVLPDGKALLYTIWTGGTFATAKVVAQSLVTNQRREIIVGAQAARYVSSGHIVFAREGGLYAVPFDARKLERTGPDQLILQGVAMGAVDGEAHLSVSANGSLAYLPGGVKTQAVRLVWVDRQNKVRPVSAWNAVASQPRISPDGKTLVLRVGTPWKVDVFTFDLVREIPAKLSTSGDDYKPLWMPNGQKVVFTSGRNGQPNLFRKSVDGTGQEEPLTSDDGIKIADSVLPDGNSLAFTWIRAGSADVWVLPLDGAKPFGILTNIWSESEACFSPDTRWLAYTSEESGQKEIYVQSYPSGANKSRISNDGGQFAVWARNGQELFYRSGRKLMVVESVTKDTFHPGKPKLVLEGDFETQFDVTPDGKEFVMVQRDLSASTFTRFNWVQDWAGMLKQQFSGK